jgi:hypothetical protein
LKKIKSFREQNYQELKKKHNKNNLFSDPLFKPENKSLFLNRECSEIVWKRPKDVFPDAKFVVDGFNRNDFDQGFVDNSWFIACCVGIMQSDKTLSRVIPVDQSFSDDLYNGLFHFRFYYYGEWVDVVIDDFLPFWPSSNELVFCKNKEKKYVFWTALLEKAYAKLYGSFERLDGLQISDAFCDMTGGLCEIYNSYRYNNMYSLDLEKIWKIVSESFERGSIIGCRLYNPSDPIGTKLANGLCHGNGYVVNKVFLFENKQRLIRLR